MTKPAYFDSEILRRYDQPGPRYTSYPTAPQFVTQFDEKNFREFALLSNTASTPRRLSIYIHVPYCFSPCFYCGCNRQITRDRSKGDRYLEQVIGEIKQVAPLFDSSRQVVQIHLGGGTPNFLCPALLKRLVETLDSHFRFSTALHRDFSIELDPRFVAPGDIQALAQVGFNRASLGVQDFDPDVQRAVNRIQGVEQTLSVIAACRESGFRSTNVDLIYGLPRQSCDGFRKTLSTVVNARPDRIALYGYAHLPTMFKAQRQIRNDELPDAGQRLQLLQLAVEVLTSAGYRYIGMDHFALPEDDLALAQAAGQLHRNFMGYTTHPECDLVGFGVSSISHIGDSYSQNTRDLHEWEAALDQDRLPVWRGLALTLDDVLRADVIQQLMCHGEIDMTDTERRFAISFMHYFADTWPDLTRLADDGLLTIGPGKIAATPHGRYLLRIIAMCFDSYLKYPDTRDSMAHYSKAI